ncbi:hypothetical protein RCL1_001812 [Eukaryota sp. TZLM3-RCL]
MYFSSFSLSNRDALVELVSALLEDMFTAPPPSVPSQFGSEPPTSLSIWVRRITSCCRLDSFVTLLSVYYLDRMHRRNPSLKISSINGHRCFLVSCCLAAKFCNDQTYLNDYWASLGAPFYTRALMNTMELEMLDMLGWNLRVEPSELACFLSEKLQTLRLKEPDLVDSFLEYDSDGDNLLSPQCKVSDVTFVI